MAILNRTKQIFQCSFISLDTISKVYLLNSDTRTDYANTINNATQKIAGFLLYSRLLLWCWEYPLISKLVLAIYGDRWASGLSSGACVRVRTCQIEHFYIL